MNIIPGTNSNIYKPGSQKPNQFSLTEHSILFSGDVELENTANPLEDNQQDTEWPNNKCAFCNNEFETPLNKLGSHPICGVCEINISKKIFPTWVKLFFAGILALVICSVCWNMRFYLAYLNIQHSLSENSKDDIVQVSNYMIKAANQVPESGELSKLAHYYKGLNFLMNDKSKLALNEFDYCQDLDASFKINMLTLQAENGAAFDSKDYPLFLKTSKAFLQLDTTSAQSWAGVASAYACMYATSNVDSLKQQSLNFLNKAKAIDDTSSANKEYYEIIHYRLDSKQIISRTQFHKQFPKGYLKTN
jgi:hypothetical protein